MNALDSSQSRQWLPPLRPPARNEAVTCERCGAFGAYAWDGMALCLDCYAAQCSCCNEFEGRTQAPIVQSAQSELSHS